MPTINAKQIQAIAEFLTYRDAATNDMLIDMLDLKDAIQTLTVPFGESHGMVEIYMGGMQFGITEEGVMHS